MYASSCTVTRNSGRPGPIQAYIVADSSTSQRMYMRLAVARITPLFLAALWCGCHDRTSPDGILETATVIDPSGDTFGSPGTMWDFTALTVSRDTTSIIIRLDFTTSAFSAQTNLASGMIVFVDFDTDQNVETGGVPAIDEFRPTTGTSVLGADYELAMNDFGTDSTVRVFDANGIITGRVKPVFSGQTVTIRIPRTMLGNDEGFLNAAAIVGTNGRATDIVPESGHLTLNPKASR
jgi:hypothetical protein